VGIDIDPVRVAESNENAAAAGLTGKVRFLQKDLFEADFRDATVITMYLLTRSTCACGPSSWRAQAGHAPRLAQLRDGRLEARQDDRGHDVVRRPADIHFWIVPANVSGRWDWDIPVGGQKRHVTFRAARSSRP